MGNFRCSKCNCVDNTALGWYWLKDEPDLLIWDESNEAFKGKALCSECAPKLDREGNKTGYGAWHNRFSKDDISVYSAEYRKHIYNT